MCYCRCVNDTGLAFAAQAVYNVNRCEHKRCEPRAYVKDYDVIWNHNVGLYCSSHSEPTVDI